MTISKQIKKNIEEFDYIARQKSCIIINSLEKEAEFQELLENIKQSHISFIENETEWLRGEIEKIKTLVQKETGSFKYDSCYDDVISLLPTNTKREK